MVPKELLASWRALSNPHSILVYTRPAVYIYIYIYTIPAVDIYIYIILTGYTLHCTLTITVLADDIFQWLLRQAPGKGVVTRNGMALAWLTGSMGCKLHLVQTRFIEAFSQTVGQHKLSYALIFKSCCFCTEGGGRAIGENKALTSRKNR